MAAGPSAGADQGAGGRLAARAVSRPFEAGLVLQCFSLPFDPPTLAEALGFQTDPAPW